MKRALTSVLSVALACSLCTVPAIADTTEESDVSLDSQSGQLEISEAGTYTLTGTMRGTVSVDPGEGDVTLIMDGVVIDGDAESAIEVVSGDSLTVVLADGSSNTLSSSVTSNDGVIESSVDTTFEGSGSLSVVAESGADVYMDSSDVTFEDGNYQMTSLGDAIVLAGENPGTATFNGGTFLFRVGGAVVNPVANMVNNGATIQQESLSADSAASASTQATGQSSASTQATGQSSAQDPMGDQQNPGDLQEATDASDDNEATGDSDSASSDPFGGNGLPTPPEGQGFNGPGAPFNGGQFDPANNQVVQGTVDEPGEVVEGTVTNAAANLVEDIANAVTYVMSDEDNQVTISDAGTYVVTGTCSDGNITVKKGTTGVVLILQDLDLTSTTGATVSINKSAEVKVVVSGNVVLTDNEDPADEDSTDEAVADAFDGAALKAKANSQVYLTGDGTLTINGTAKNGIKVGDDASLIIDGVTLNITAANDGINSNYDLTILSGEVTIEAGDDAIHADRILTVGSEDGTGPTINVVSSTEGLEGTVVNIYGDDLSIVSSDDGINAANSDAAYEDELDYSINVMGGSISIDAQGDGLDSNGNVNLIDGSATISSASGEGEAGIDYDGDLYVSDDFDLNNNSGVSGADGEMPQDGQPGGQGFGPMPGTAK